MAAPLSDPPPDLRPAERISAYVWKGGIFGLVYGLFKYAFGEFADFSGVVSFTAIGLGLGGLVGGLKIGLRRLRER